MVLPMVLPMVLMVITVVHHRLHHVHKLGEVLDLFQAEAPIPILINLIEDHLEVLLVILTAHP